MHHGKDVAAAFVSLVDAVIVFDLGFAAQNGLHLVRALALVQQGYGEVLHLVVKFLVHLLPKATGPTSVPSHIVSHI